MQHVRNSWNFQDFHKVRAKDPQAWSRPWNFVKGWPTGAVDWSTVKCLSRIFSNLSMISKYRLKITRLNAKDAKDWLQHHTKQQLLIVHWTIFHIMKIEVFKMYFCKKNHFSLWISHRIRAQVAVLRSWRVVGAPPRPSARPASGRHRPSGPAARAAPPWRRAAAPRRLRQKCRCLWKPQPKLNVCRFPFNFLKRLQIGFERFWRFSLTAPNATPRQDTKFSRYCGSTTTKGGSGTVGSWRFAWNVAMSMSTNKKLHESSLGFFTSQ